MTAVDLRAGFAGVFGLFSTPVVTEMVLRTSGVFAFPLFTAPLESTGLNTLGDFNLISFLPLVLADVAMETLASLCAGWKNGLAAGDPKINVADLLRLVTVG